ncbi:reverse transcriptase domain-containing protein [Tanacetum coccineum]
MKTHSTAAWMTLPWLSGSPSQHNAIIGRPGIRKIRVVPSTAHGMLKFPVEGGTVTLQSSRVIPMECAMISGPSTPVSAVNQIAWKAENKYSNQPETQSTLNRQWPIGSTLQKRTQCKKKRTGTRKEIGNPRRGGGKISRTLEFEGGSIIHSGFSNPVMVKKHDGTWRMCVDFKDLNNACPKDCYPLPEIDWKVESLCGYSFKCFLDAYKGYHQIKMAKEDEEKTAFITSQGIFCYSKMPFGLKNAGSTYQRLVDKAFQKQIGRNLEVYVDDLVIKSHTEEEIIRDITETFKTLRQINMKLNPKKCTFGMQEGMFLGYKVSTNGLRACSEKADAVLSLPSPRCIKDVQKLNGKLASLNRFLSKSAEKSLPFFKTLKKCTKKSDFQWTPEAEEAFRQIKKLIAELPTLTAPRENEELIIYLAAAKEAISAVLMTDREGRQIPVYFVSRTLRGPEVNYTPMEKLVLALLSARCELEVRLEGYDILNTDQGPQSKAKNCRFYCGTTGNRESPVRIWEPEVTIGAIEAKARRNHHRANQVKKFVMGQTLSVQIWIPGEILIRQWKQERDAQARSEGVSSIQGRLAKVLSQSKINTMTSSIRNLFWNFNKRNQGKSASSNPLPRQDSCSQQVWIVCHAAERGGWGPSNSMLMYGRQNLLAIP